MKKARAAFAPVVHPHWRGGFFDGDGSVMYKKCGQYVRPALGIAACISRESRYSLDCFHLKYGGALSENKKVKNASCRPIYQWEVGGSAVFPALEDLCDSGLCIKRPQANLLLERRDLFPGIVGRAGLLSESVRQARLGLQEELRALRARMLNDTTSQM